MLYRSSRSNNTTASVTFEECVLEGLASDGGFILPETIPQVNVETLRSWSALSYRDLVFQVAKLYVDPAEIPVPDLQRIIKGAYREEDFPTDAIPIVHLGNGLSVAELFHGPTMAFKDLSVACMGAFLDYFLKKRQRWATVLVATSGDTGGSVVQNFKSFSSVDVVVMFPKGRCNEIQELHMTTVNQTNVHCFSVEGTSDDEDVVMMSILNDKDFVRTHHATLANSANWARILAQVANYIYVYVKSGVVIGRPLHLIIPTGGAGSATAACVAQSMGVPLTLALAVNANDVLHRCLRDGRLPLPTTTALQTLASAMDIQFPYNFERLLRLFAPTAESCLQDLLAALHDGRDAVIPEAILAQMRRVITSSASIDDDKILKTIGRCHQEQGYLVCPHTATAVACFYDSVQSPGSRPTTSVCIATASPKKFPEVVRRAGVPCHDEHLAELRRRPIGKTQSLLRGQDWVAVLRRKIEDISERRHNETSKFYSE